MSQVYINIMAIEIANTFYADKITYLTNGITLTETLLLNNEQKYLAILFEV